MTTPHKEIEEQIEEIWSNTNTAEDYKKLFREYRTTHREAIRKELVEDFVSMFDEYEDEGDDRYGYTKHWNTTLMHMEDHALSIINHTLGDNNK